MGTYDPMMFDNNNYTDQDANDIYGQQEDPDKQDDDTYRYVASRLSDRSSSPPLGKTAPGKQQQPSDTAANMPNMDGEQDPFGSLFSQLAAAMGNQPQQVPSSNAPSNGLRNPGRPSGPSQPKNPALSNIANRAVNDALRDAELYDSFDQYDPNGQQQNPFIAQDNSYRPNPQKNIKKQDAPPRIKGTRGSNSTSNSNADPSKTPRRPGYQPPSKSNPPNHIEKNIDMIKNKENYYNRYPPRKYEESYARRKELQGIPPNTYDEESPSNRPRKSSLPLTVNIHTSDSSHNRSLPATVTVPIDTDTNRPGEPLSVDINLRLVDPENRQQQGSGQPNWANQDALDRHIRKMERGLDYALPPTNSAQRSSIVPSTSTHPSSTGRYGKPTVGATFTGYNPPNFARERYSYSDKGPEENSYLAKMNYAKKHTDYKPYTTRDYERFKKNCGFGTGHLGFDSDNTSYKEKAEKAAKLKEYAQHIEERNRQKLADAHTRASSGIPSPTNEAKTLRLFEQAQLGKRTVQFAKKSPRSSPNSMNEVFPFSSARRPTDAPYRPRKGHRPTDVGYQPTPARRHPTDVNPYSPPTRRRPTDSTSHSPPIRRPIEPFAQPSPPVKRRTKFPANENPEPVERFIRQPQRDISPARRSLNPPIKRRDQIDDNDSRRGSNIESPLQNRPGLRHLSPTKVSSPSSQTNSDIGKRRPLRFDNFLPEESRDSPPEQQYRPVQLQQPPRRPIQPPQQQYHPIQPPQQRSQRNSREDLLDKPQVEDDSLMRIIRDELSERPLGENEELVIVE